MNGAAMYATVSQTTTMQMTSYSILAAREPRNSGRTQLRISARQL